MSGVRLPDEPPEKTVIRQSFSFGEIMEIIEYNGRKIEYEIVRKNVKNINLRVKRDASVAVSANKSVPKAFIEKFVAENAEKIFSAVDKISMSETNPVLENGSKISLLGKNYDLIIRKSTENSYFIDDTSVVFYVSDTKSTEIKTEIYNTLLTNTAKVVFPKLLKECYPAFENVCAAVPELKIKNLKSQWGNCYHKRNLITLNLRLAVFDMNVIRCVVYHEYCHFVYQNHSRDFYKLLETVMPEWKQYNRVLKQKTSL